MSASGAGFPSSSIVSSSPSPTSAPTSPPVKFQQPLSNSTFVFRVNLCIYTLIGLVVVLRIPHLIGLFGTSADWYSGHLFRYVGGRRRRGSGKARRERAQRARARAMHRNDSSRTVVADPTGSGKEKDVTDISLDDIDDSRYAYPPSPAGAQLQRPHQRHPPSTSSGRSSHDDPDDAPAPRYPAHVPAVPAAFRGILSLLRARSMLLVPGYSLGQLVVLVVYFWILVFALLYKSNPFIDASRPAWVAVAQVPLVLVLGAKGGNVAGALLGYGYERLNYIHRFGGRMIVIGCNLHGIFYVYRWTSTGMFTQNIVFPANAWGLALLVAVNVLFIFSTSIWRQKAYNVFIWSHIIAVLVVLPSIYMHQGSLWLYALASSAIYVFDRLLRLAKTRITTAVLIPQINSPDTILLEVPSLNAGWRAGQHVRIRVLAGRAAGLGAFAWAEIHPFTIASVAWTSGGAGEGLAVIIKKNGGWTQRLVKLGTSRRDRAVRQRREAQEKGLADLRATRDVESEVDALDLSVRVRVWLEGPYGGCGRMIFASFSAALIVCGGSGISFGLSVLHDLSKKDELGESRLKYVELIWVVPDATSVDAILPGLLELVEEFDEEGDDDDRSGNWGGGGSGKGSRRGRRGRGTTAKRRKRYTQVKVGVWFTRALRAKLSVMDGEWSDVAGDDAFRPVAVHPNVIISPGRPRVARSLDVAMGRAVTLGQGEEGEERGVKGVAVGVCGPGELAQEVASVVGRVDVFRRDQVGGIEVHEETFGM